VDKNIYLKNVIYCENPVKPTPSGIKQNVCSEKEGNLRPRAKEFYLLLKKEADRTLLLSPLGQNK